MDFLEEIYSWIVILIVCLLCLGAPLYLTYLEITMLLLAFGKGKKRRSRMWDLITVGYGVFCTVFYLSLLKTVRFDKNWQEVLSNSEKHAPIHTGSAGILVAVLMLAVFGYFLISTVPLEKMPPLLLVTALSALYLGTLESVIFFIQVFQYEVPFDYYLLLLPLNCLMISARMTKEKCEEWKMLSYHPEKMDRIPLLGYLNRILQKSERWPMAAFLLMWPLLGILIGILWLFGQEPDAVIRAWTETSDWNLSNRVAPQNIYYDEHYLCTVAAGGHEKIVKPLRLGVRHGHEVIVNRQLLVANAFEQVLEEKMPAFHKKVRRFYDTYGFPVAKLIRTKIAADIIYVVMKPLEWMFLIVLYFVDVNPENRIAVQYTGKKK